jgi:hypothetical protein
MKKRIPLFSFLRNGLFWTALSGVATLLLCWVAYYQLNESNRSAQDQNKIAAEIFLHNLKTDFFTPEARNLIFLMEINALQFRVIREDSGKATEMDLLIFEKNIPSKFKKYADSILPAKSFFSSNELDDHLLNHFEDLGILYRKHLIDSFDIYEDFSYYISICHEDSAVIKYISWLRQDNKDKDIYQNFDIVYHLVYSMSR